MQIADPVYAIEKSYDENYLEGPVFHGRIPKTIPEAPPISFLGLPANSRLGIPAGPLLNSEWISFYARMGFDLLVYKTVRTHPHPSYPSPNCLYVSVNGDLTPDVLSTPLIGIPRMEPASMRDITITNSFGMPSQDPSVWQKDVALSRTMIGKGQVLIVSVVGTERGGESIGDNFARAAKMAVEAGAMAIEMNFSCPNVKGSEGQLFQDPKAAGEIARKVRKELGTGTPLVAKVGYIESDKAAGDLVSAVAPHLDGIAAINTLSATIINPEGRPALPGEGRERSGVCGNGIRKAALGVVSRLAREISSQKVSLSLIGVGGIMTVEDVDLFLASGADFAMAATGAMWDPFLAYHMKQQNLR
ncbi:MAG: beta/alpha barrel domain-containing protein [Leptospirales bacterium]